MLRSKPTSIPDHRLPLTAGAFLVCFDGRIGTIRHHVIWAPRITARVTLFRRDDYADAVRDDAVMVTACEESIPWRVVRVWRGMSRKDFDAQLAGASSRESLSRLCPNCRAERNRRHEETRAWKRRRLQELVDEERRRAADVP